MPTRPAAPCPHCRSLAWKNSRCTACGYTRRRNYNGPHAANRRTLKARHPNGPCWRCGQPGTWDDPNDPLEVGHIDPDGPNTLANSAPEHRSHNRAAARRDGFT